MADEMITMLESLKADLTDAEAREQKANEALSAWTSGGPPDSQRKFKQRNYRQGVANLEGIRRSRASEALSIQQMILSAAQSIEASRRAGDKSNKDKDDLLSLTEALTTLKEAPGDAGASARVNLTAGYQTPEQRRLGAAAQALGTRQGDYQGRMNNLTKTFGGDEDGKELAEAYVMRDAQLQQDKLEADIASLGRRGASVGKTPEDIALEARMRTLGEARAKNDLYLEGKDPNQPQYTQPGLRSMSWTRKEDKVASRTIHGTSWQKALNLYGYNSEEFINMDPDAFTDKGSVSMGSRIKAFQPGDWEKVMRAYRGFQISMRGVTEFSDYSSELVYSVLSGVIAHDEIPDAVDFWNSTNLEDGVNLEANKDVAQPHVRKITRVQRIALFGPEPGEKAPPRVDTEAALKKLWTGDSHAMIQDILNESYITNEETGETYFIPVISAQLASMGESISAVGSFTDINRDPETKSAYNWLVDTLTGAFVLE